MTLPVSPTDRAGVSSDAGAGYPRHESALPDLDARTGRYHLRFARSQADLDAVLRLRFAVFNLELGEGLDGSFQTGLDDDGLDESFHHLMIVSADTNDVVGTYRLQTSEMARAGSGFYSAGEYDVEALPTEVIAESIEIGRACVSREHRNGRVLHLLWRGLASYLSWNRKRYLFGCCSLSTLDPDEGRRAYAFLRAAGHVHPTLQTPAVPAVRCPIDEQVPSDVTYDIPPLFESYLRLGAKVCGPPAIDRQFKTIDFLVILDAAALDRRTYRTFFQDDRAAAKGP